MRPARGRANSPMWFERKPPIEGAKSSAEVKAVTDSTGNDLDGRFIVHAKGKWQAFPCPRASATAQTERSVPPMSGARRRPLSR